MQLYLFYFLLFFLKYESNNYPFNVCTLRLSEIWIKFIYCIGIPKIYFIMKRAVMQALGILGLFIT